MSYRFAGDKVAELNDVCSVRPDRPRAGNQTPNESRQTAGSRANFESNDMLQDANAIATLAVKNLRVAAKFYEDTLGLTRADEEVNEAIVLESGDSRINVYRSKFAGTNQATALTWTVQRCRRCRPHAESQGREVRTLRFAGNDAPRVMCTCMATMKVALFRGSDGDILSLVNR